MKNRSLSTQLVPRIKIHQMYFKINSNAIQNQRLEREHICHSMLVIAHGF